MPNSESIVMTPPSESETVANLLPVGVWIRLALPDNDVVCFTYIDDTAGFTAQGWKVEEAYLDQSSRIIIRFSGKGFSWRRLESDEIQAYGLEVPPSWVAEFYGPQPAANSMWGIWREHPKLKGRFLPDYPDDLQVLVHDGGPRISSNPAEVVWVSVRGMKGEVFQGRMLNQPSNLKNVRYGDKIQFVVADGAEFPVMVTEKYLRECGAWVIHPCNKCGFSELFDAPSDLIRVVFPKQPAGMIMIKFTAFCPLCGGIQVIESKNNPDENEEEAVSAPLTTKRPWWRFWG
ncbi:MAG: DUF2314 domain-containing protein [Candidatus Aminicenantes bacterium]|nr:DUF2314 domain-containing protein [Candidatus Aminicenantes bacterium]